MSYGGFAVGDANAVKRWSMEVAQAERDSLEIAPLMGEEDAIIYVKKELSKGPGDQVTFNLRGRPTQKGISASDRAEGNAESLSIYSDALLINEIGANFGAKSENTIDQQRVPFSLREQCKNAARDWWSDRMSKTFFNIVCGFTPSNTESATAGKLFTGLNTVTAPAGTGRQIWAGTATNDQGLGSSDTFSLALIDKAVEAARLGNSMVRPINVGGRKKYVMYLHDAQVTALRTTTSTGGWQDITKFTYSGVSTKDNPLYGGALGEYNDVILRRSQDVTLGVHNSTGAQVSNVRRAVLLGAQAVVCGYGTKFNEGRRYRWSEKLLDHDRLLEVAIFSIMGMKKTVFNSTDHGTVVVSTYSSS